MRFPAAVKATKFERVPLQFVAALGDPEASSGSGAERWGVWRGDPGPRGVKLSEYQTLKENGLVARAGWALDANDWWLEEHGLIMETPDFPLPAGRYRVTGGRKLTTSLTISSNGGWSLADGKLYDVTHLPCRAARYTKGEPSRARQSDFPVAPGGPMPPVEGCDKQDYTVIFITGIAAA